MTNLVFIQAAEGLPPANATSSSLLYPSFPTTSASYLLTWCFTNGDTVASVTDTLGNLWIPVFSTGSIQIFQVPSNRIGGGSNTVTVHYANGTNTFAQYTIAEYTGQLASSPFDVGSAQSFNGGTVVTLGANPVTTTAANETVIFVGIVGDSPTWTNVGNYTVRFGPPAAVLVDGPATTVGAYTPTASMSGAENVFGCTFAIRSSATILPSTASWLDAGRTFINKRGD